MSNPTDVVQLNQLVNLKVTAFGTKGDGIAHYGPGRLVIIVKRPVELDSTYECRITGFTEKCAFAEVLQELR